MALTNSSLILVLLTVTVVNAKNIYLAREWREWKLRYGKVYSNQTEETERRHAWERSFYYIRQHSNRPGDLSFTVGMNSRADIVAGLELVDPMPFLPEALLVNPTPAVVNGYHLHVMPRVTWHVEMSCYRQVRAFPEIKWCFGLPLILQMALGTRNQVYYMADLLDQPIMAVFDASHTSFQLYRSYVHFEKHCSSIQLDHVVQIVGYGVENGTDFWIVKNSWGADWGMNGYILMSRNKDNQCGIASAASFPVLG
ncbi:cathepsin J-like [Ylistrum balloti]|uniref:cathepsin J-like n=1 Tax=Ylistrum balloti TaxID=509963 RepID=UPI002905B53F|nr:cathepsin J-like [Ylistrum balloti]